MVSISKKTITDEDVAEFKQTMRKMEDASQFVFLAESLKCNLMIDLYRISYMQMAVFVVLLTISVFSFIATMSGATGGFLFIATVVLTCGSQIVLQFIYPRSVTRKMLALHLRVIETQQNYLTAKPSDKAAHRRGVAALRDIHMEHHKLLTPKAGNKSGALFAGSMAALLTLLLLAFGLVS